MLACFGEVTTSHLVLIDYCATWSPELEAQLMSCYCLWISTSDHFTSTTSSDIYEQVCKLQWRAVNSMTLQWVFS